MFSKKNSIKRLISLTGLSLILSAAVVSNVFAEEKIHSESVRVGYYENEVLQEGASKGAVKRGYAYEYYRKISEYTGWHYDYVYGDYNDLYDMLLEGRIDLLAGLAYVPERVSLISYPDIPMGYSSYCIVKNEANDEITQDIQSFTNKKIGVLDSAMVQILDNWLKREKVSAEPVVFRTLEQISQNFESGGIDCYVTEGSSFYMGKNLKIVATIGTNDFYLCVNKDRPDLLKKLNNAQRELTIEEPNYLNSLYNTYYPVSVLSRNLSPSEAKWIDNNNAVRIGYLNNYLPYSDTTKDGKVDGLVKDIVPKIFEQVESGDNYTIIYESFDSYDRMIAALNESKIDAAFPVGGGLYFSEVNNLYQSKPVIKSTVNIIFNRMLEKSENPVFAVNKNNSMQEYFLRTCFPDRRIKFYDSIDDCLKAVKKGEVNCTVLNGLRVETILKNSKYSLLSSEVLPLNDELCFGIQIGNEGLLRLFNRELNSISYEYVLDCAYKYTPKLYKTSFSDFLRTNCIPLAIILIVLITAFLAFFITEFRKKKIYLAKETKKNEELRIAHKEQETRLIEIKLLNNALEQSRKNTDRYINDMLRYASSGDDPDTVLNQLLDYLGKRTDGDRIYIFEINKNGNYDNTYEWCKKGVNPEIDILQNLPGEIITHWIDLFKKSKAVIITDIEKSKDKYPQLYEILKPQKINTLIAIPIIINDEITGLLGVDNPPKEKIQYISDFLFLAEFVFSQWIRIRNHTRELQNSAIHDQLTGCKNRKGLVETFNKNYNEEHSCFVVACDMNGLKQVNDGQGHDAGDKFICRTANTLGDVFGFENVYRIGGDEFTIILFEKTLQEYEEFMKACKLQIGTIASVGSIYVEKMSGTLDALLKQSDMEMYREKDKFYQNKRVRRNHVLSE